MRLSPRQKLIPLVAALALGLPAAAGAQELGFNYVEGGLIAGFVNDVEGSGAITGGGTATFETDAGGGAFVNGAWQVGENMHLFGDFSSTGQELEVSDGIDTVEGEFDVVRWRLGVGYAHALSSTTQLYGRLSYDSAELKDFQVAGFDLDADFDEGGVGGEVGVNWAATPTIHVQGHVRYTSVGDVANGGNDAFDSDILVGVNGRWYFRPDMALVTGYELGKITTWNLGLRFAF